MKTLAVLSLGMLVAAPARAQQPSYRVARTVALGGEARWDYLTADPGRHRVFVSHGTEVIVVGADTGEVQGRIADTPGVHGVALAPALGRGFTSNGRDSSVTIFDYGSLAPLQRVTVTGRNPDAIVYDPVSGRVFTMNGGSGNATALDAATGKVVGTVQLGGKPEFAVADGRGRIFVNLEDRGALVSFDTRTLEPGPTWPLGSCEEPTGLALDPRRRRLFSVCGNRIMVVVDADSGTVLGTAPIGAGSDGARFDSGTDLAISSNGEGSLTLVDGRGPDFSVVQTVTTARGARTLALDQATHVIYTATAQYPAADNTGGHPRPLPGTFSLLIVRP